MYKNILTQIEDIGGAFIAKPITDEAFKTLKKQIDLPTDYVNFLYDANGLYWGGLEFFGSVPQKANDLNITDIVTQNNLYAALNPKSDCIFLGRTDEENFVYLTRQKCYQMIDEFSGDVIKTFPSFERLLSYVVNEQSEIVQNYVGFSDDDVADESQSKEDF